MSSPTTHDRLASLRTELAELAYDLDRRGHHDAADVAMMVSARIAEMEDELERTDAQAGSPASTPGATSVSAATNADAHRNFIFEHRGA